MSVQEKQIEQAYELAARRYSAIGIETAAVLDQLASIAISLHCWQGDDVGGFENAGEEIGGGLAVTGNYPGKARTPDQLRADLQQAYSLIPGTHRLNLHASYGEFPGSVDRDQVGPEHFRGWIDWAEEQLREINFSVWTRVTFIQPK